MIISHQYRFIFIKTHKTAGSSLEMAMGPLCGADDVITHMEDNLDSGVPRNYGPGSKLGKYYNRHKLVRKLVGKHSPLLGAFYYEHMPAWRVKELVAPHIWQSYFKFCVERNPWDKVVSYYLWKTHGQSRQLPPFRDYVLNKTHRLPTDGKLYFNNENLLVDKVYEFRQLGDMLTELRDKLGVPISEPLPREKTGIKADRKPYADYYDEQTRARVADVYQREIALMQYRF